MVKNLTLYYGIYRREKFKLSRMFSTTLRNFRVYRDSECTFDNSFEIRGEIIENIPSITNLLQILHKIRSTCSSFLWLSSLVERIM